MAAQVIQMCAAGIMVGGRLRCLGSVQRLKGRFGRGYELQVRRQRLDRLGCIGRLPSAGVA
jgi:hypothetical protein